ncbi:MAG: tetratricopeptide repeat protein, partial [Myxococcota bacterium]
RRVALGLTGAVAVGGALAWGAPPPACEPDVALLGGAWSPEHRARVRQSFVDAGDVGLTAWSTVSHEVDAAVALWTEQNLQACVLARDPEPQTAARGRTGLACSVRAAAVIRDLAPVVETAEPSERLRAEGLRGVVTRLVDCESGVSPQTEASLALASQMDHAVLAATLGRYDRVEALVRGILDAPESESLPSVRASAHTMFWWVGRIRDERDEERRHLHDALAAAERGDHPNRIAQIWGDLAILEARSGNPARAEFFLDRARRFVSEGRVSTIRAAGLTMVEGQVLRFAGRHDEALPFFERAVAACREVAPGSALLGWALSNLAEAHASLGKPSKALASNVEAVEVFTRALGGGHPDTAVAEAHLGARYVDAGECDRATPHLDRALASLRADPVVFPEERTKAQRARARCAP